MMHQCQRLVSIADDLPTIRRNVESLQVMFLMTCVEHIAKLHDRYVGEGQSRAYVQRFFDSFVTGGERRTMEIAFTDDTDHLMRPLDLRRAVDVLYDVRCDVVHEGNYWGFNFHDGRMPMLNNAPDVTANITLAQLRNLVVRGCISAVTDALDAPYRH